MKLDQLVFFPPFCLDRYNACLLHGWLESALQGVQQVVFVTGELGMSSTVVVGAFLEHAVAGERIWINLRRP